jgi:hypothetical protein
MTSEHAGGRCADVGGADRNHLIRHANLLDPALVFPHPHSIVPGGFDVTSYTTRLTPLISLMM